MAISVLSTTALKSSIDELASVWIGQSGHELAVSYAPSARISERIRAGERPDVVVATRECIDEFVGGGLVMAGSVRDLARSGIGVAVQKGRAKPDVSSVEQFRDALLRAESIAMSNPVGGGQSGRDLVRIFDELGIAGRLQGKLRYGPGGPAGLIGLMLMRGEAEMGLQQIPELMAVPGIDLLGPLPAVLQVETTFSVGLLSCASDLAGATWLDFMTEPAAFAVMASKGFCSVAN